MKLWAFGLALFVVALYAAVRAGSFWGFLALIAAYYSGRIDQRSQDRDTFAWLRRRLKARRRHAQL